MHPDGFRCPEGTLVSQEGRAGSSVFRNARSRTAPAVSPARPCCRSLCGHGSLSQAAILRGYSTAADHLSGILQIHGPKTPFRQRFMFPSNRSLTCCLQKERGSCPVVSGPPGTRRGACVIRTRFPARQSLCFQSHGSSFLSRRPQRRSCRFFPGKQWLPRCLSGKHPAEKNRLPPGGGCPDGTACTEWLLRNRTRCPGWHRGLPADPTQPHRSKAGNSTGPGR